ncbi:MAG TPA: hypothetical protein VFZ59_16090 [Verrucomicrobiae bacterium]|nr:hypothetical protein [Verrucomicrobiae bacterium]
MNAIRKGLGQSTLLLLLFVFLNGAASATPLQLVSKFGHPGPAGGSGDSCLPVLSSDGRLVLFASTANNLVLSSNGLPIPSLVPVPFNVYLRDRSNQVTSLVSVGTNQIAGGNGDSIPVALSTNAQFVLFESSANNLVAKDTNNATDIFLRDLISGATSLVSVSTNGFAGNGASRRAVMTPDGRYVAFVSEASDLVSGDTNKIADVFVRDLQTLTTTLISIGAVSTNPSLTVPFGSSESPEISADGRYVAFSSTATNVVPGVRTAGDIYVHDRVAGTNIWVSSGMRARLQAAKGTTNGVCYNLALSDDGKFVAYQASVSPLGAGVNSGIILRYSLETELTDLIHTNAPTAIPVAEETRNLDLTPDGSVIAFVANSNGVQATTTCVQVWNASSASVTLVSGNLSNLVTTGSLSTRPVIDATGRYVVFVSSAANLVTNSLSGLWHVYVRDLLTATPTLVNATTNEMGTSVSASTVATLSANGRLVAFESVDGGLVPNDHNRSLDVFVRDLDANTNELISAHHATLPSASASGPSLLSEFAASADGRFVAFASEVDDPAMGDTNGYRDVFVRDLAHGTNLLVSVTPWGMTGNGSSSEPAISGDGRYVAFASAATNLALGDTNGMTDVFVRDLQTGITVLASAKPSGGSANSNAYSPVLNADGRWLMFRSQARDLVSGNFSSRQNLFLRDMQTTTTWALTTGGVYAEAMTPDGRFVALSGHDTGVGGDFQYVWDSFLATRVFTNTTLGVTNVAISSDGNWIAYSIYTQLRVVDRARSTNWLVTLQTTSSISKHRLSADGRWLVFTRPVTPNSWNQVNLYDVQNRTEFLVSHALDFTPGAGGHSDSAELSPDGRFVAYRTLATNIVSGVSGLTRQIILYDRQTGINTLVSASRYTGLPGNDHSLRATFSADGQTLLLQSWASDLAVNDFNRSGDVLAKAIFTAVILPPVAGQAPWIYWPFELGNNYNVQFKSNLNDAAWQPTAGIMTNVGNKVWFQDSFATNSQRFYRIQSN